MQRVELKLYNKKWKKVNKKNTKTMPPCNLQKRPKFNSSFCEPWAKTGNIVILRK